MHVEGQHRRHYVDARTQPEILNARVSVRSYNPLDKGLKSFHLVAKFGPVLVLRFSPIKIDPSLAHVASATALTRDKRFLFRLGVPAPI